MPSKNASGIPESADLLKQYQDLKRAEEALRVKTGELEALNAFGRAVNANLALAQTVTAALQGIVDTVRPDVSFLFLRDGDRLVLLEALPPSNRKRLGAVPEHRVGECICGLAVSEGRRLYSRDIFSDPRCIWEECKKAGLKSFAALPLFSGDAIVGVIGLASDETRDFEAQDGFLETLASQVSIAMSNALHYEALQRELKERRQSEETLRESEERFSKAFKTSPYAYMIANMEDGAIFEVNDAFTAISGFSRKEALAGSTLKLNMWVNEEDRKRMVATLRDDRAVTGLETQLRGKNGTIMTVLLFAQVIQLGHRSCIISIMQDITERKRMEEELQRAQKLDALGVLAGGIAHDFNNLLTGIFGYIDLARTVSKEAKTKEYLESTIASMNRARGLTMQLLTFAKGGSPVQRTTPLFPFIQDAALFALSGSSVSCRFDVAKDLRPCNIDMNQISQVIDNIVINAQQAMPSGGAIEISARNVSCGENERPLLAKGDYVKISIKDQGIGIPKEIMSRIFDPFYTTKIKGHGLGLATCYSIVNRHGGWIDVESEPGKGSTFHVYLPVSKEIPVEEPVRITRHKGSGTIIVMDDEDSVRSAVKEVLELLGYTVVCKNDGREAVDHYLSETRAGRSFAAMILDLTIPGGMGGVEAVAEIRKLDKHIPVFVASGYADNSVMKTPVEYGFTASISKPFTIAELSEMLNKNVIQ
jgi:PAS domain S-box-containing protein